MNDFINETASKAIKLIQEQAATIRKLEERWNTLRAKVEENPENALEYMKQLEEGE